MPITTYISDSERKRLSVIDDKEMSELMEEIKQLGGRNMLVDKIVITENRRWFRKPKEKILYQLYIEHNPTLPEVQVFNFASNDSGSINTMVDRGAILNYLFGFRNGLYEEWEQKEKKR